MIEQRAGFRNLHTTQQFEEALDALEKEISLSTERYEAAQRSYNSVGEWLNRVNSTVIDLEPQVYVQGSFRLGTAIKPWTDQDEYDVEAVCELQAGSPHNFTQKQIKELIGTELQYYAKAKVMSKAPKEGKRCWTIEYADGAQFHLDVLPAIPHQIRQSNMGRFQQTGANSLSFIDTALAITDTKHPKYKYYSVDWPNSNPKGYAKWFRSRTEARMLAEKQVLAKQLRESVEDIPDFRVRTPLQACVKLLKRHRDIMFAGNPEHAPISIVISTLAGWAYQGEAQIGEALVQVALNMHRYIEWDNGYPVVLNPVDPNENFAEKWQSEPEKWRAFQEWLQRVRNDVLEMLNSNDIGDLCEVAKCSFGHRTVQRAFGRQSNNRFVEAYRSVSNATSQAKVLAKASYRRAAPWPAKDLGRVWFETVVWTKNGFRRLYLSHDDDPVYRNGRVKFTCVTNIVGPYEVFWQVVNSGVSAEAAGSLRGTFDRGAPGLTRTEDTLYPGKHAIECLIVRNGLLVARSGQFFVNIAG